MVLLTSTYYLSIIYGHFRVKKSYHLGRGAGGEGDPSEEVEA